MAMGRKLNNSARKNDKHQISSYVISRPKWLPSTEIWGPLDEYPGRRSCARNQVTWYNLEQFDWVGINYHIGILVYIEISIKQGYTINSYVGHIKNCSFLKYTNGYCSMLRVNIN